MAPASEDWTADPAIREWLSTPTPDTEPRPTPTAPHEAHRTTGNSVDDQSAAVATPAPLTSEYDGAEAYSESSAPTDVWAAAPAGGDQSWPPVAPGQAPVPAPEQVPYDTYPHVDAPVSRTSRVRRHLRDAGTGRSRWIAAGLVLAAVVVLGVGFLVSTAGHDQTPAPVGQGIAIPSGAASSTPTPAPADADCPNHTEGATTTGRDAGDSATGPGVIKAFNYSYYVERSGEKARSVVTPTGKPGSAQQMQAGIDRVDPQTLHCLSITDKGAGLYAVQLTEIPPNGTDVKTVHELVQTTTTGGRTWIVSISKDPAFP